MQRHMPSHPRPPASPSACSPSYRRRMANFQALLTHTAIGAMLEPLKMLARR